jgi:Putative peptidoglycan binding domain
MKRLILITSMAALAGLFAASQALSSGEQHKGMSESGNTHEMKGDMHHGMTSAKLNQDQVRELQNLLNEKGYQVGTADGIIGTKTRTAIRDFQKSQGLTTTGRPDEQTLRALAPSAEKQEFFGLSPAYGEKEPTHNMETQPTTQQPMEQQPMKEQPMEQQQKPEGTKGY